MQTYKDLQDFTYQPDDFTYQPNLTKSLDKSCDQLATQELINEIVLWKVNRYVNINDDTLALLNNEKIYGDTISIDFTVTLLTKLIQTHGIKLAMASTILRFRNPQLYQIIDQRAYRFLTGVELKLPSTNSDQSINEQIQLYLDYLEKLKAFSFEMNIDFSITDRFLYQKDKHFNKDKKLNNYGSI